MAQTDLEELLPATENATKASQLTYALVHFCGLPDSKSTYSWFGVMSKRYGLEASKSVVVSVLENGTTVADFDNDPRHFRAWLIATIKGKASEQQNGLRVWA